MTKSVGECRADECIAQVGSLEQLRSADPVAGAIFLASPGRVGLFRWVRGDFSLAVERDPLAGRFVASRRAAPESGAWVRDSSRLTPEMFGARPGQADHYPYLAAAFDQLGDGITIELDGEYRTTRAIVVGQRANFRVVGRGRITSAAGTPVQYGYGILYLSECTDFELTTLTFDANRMGRTPREAPAHTVTFQSCHRFKVSGVRSVNAVCDGFHLFSAQPSVVETHCSDFEFLDCKADNCFRQGCSVIQGHRGIFRGGSYTNTNGTAPAAGIDLESDTDAPIGAISDIAFEGVTFANNFGFGLLVSTVARPKRIVTSNCRFDHNRRGAISWGATSGKITNPSLRGFTALAERGAIDIPAGDGWQEGEGTLIESPQFTEVSSVRPENALVYVHSQAYGPVAISRLSAPECGSIAGLHRNGSSLAGAKIRASLGRIDGAIGVSGNGCAVRDNRIEAFFGSVIIATGENVQITGNVLLQPRVNDGNGAIRVLGRGAVIEGNVLEASNASTAITVAQAARMIRGNRATGFARALAHGPD
ncbi:hypothetical protein J4558_00240 [Leptolyngbya sp. 15MV]|nr:hypothetical protein J4558_00240 [Leptolyngbya sp. 15MV]